MDGLMRGTVWERKKKLTNNVYSIERFKAHFFLQLLQNNSKKQKKTGWKMKHGAFLN
jgi:3-methyladenine DNA glycosylase AlkC